MNQKFSTIKYNGGHIINILCMLGMVEKTPESHDIIACYRYKGKNYNPTLKKIY